MTDVDISPAITANEIEAVRHLCWAYRDFLIQNSDTDREITETFYPTDKYTALMADLPRLHARPTGIMLLARADSAPIGCGMTHALDQHTSEIKRVFVSESARGQGIARNICARLIDQARLDGFSRVVLDTSRTLTGAQALYDRLGFRARGPYQPIPEEILPELRFYELIL